MSTTSRTGLAGAEQKAIAEFLGTCFNREEFVRFLQGTDAWEPLRGDLKSPDGTDIGFFIEFVGAAGRRGLLDSAFFDALILVRPRLKAEIEALHTSLGEATAVPDAQVSGTRSSASRLELVRELELLILERERGYKLGSLPDQSMARVGMRIIQISTQLRQGGKVDAGDVAAGTELQHMVGRGNFGTIWKSTTPDGVARATKIFHLEALTEGVMLWRFRRGIVAMRRLSDSPNAPTGIARIRTVSEDELSFSMDFFENGNLEQLKRLNWTLETKLLRFREICECVAFAHSVGVIHRDIKPANVVLGRDFHPVLTDFDISDLRFVTRLSVTRGGLGTQIFAAPEQLVDGDAANERSDVFSLGRLLHFMLLERPPEPLLDADKAVQNLGHVAPAIVEIVRKAVQYAPEHRYASVGEMLTDLEGCQGRRPQLVARARGGARWIQKHAAALAIPMMLFAGVLGYGVMTVRKNEALERAIELEHDKNEALKQLLAERVKTKEQDVQISMLSSKLEHNRKDLERLRASQSMIGKEIRRLATEIQLSDAKLAALPKGSIEYEDTLREHAELTLNLDRALKEESDLKAEIAIKISELERAGSGRASQNGEAPSPPVASNTWELTTTGGQDIQLIRLSSRAGAGVQTVWLMTRPVSTALWSEVEPSVAQARSAGELVEVSWCEAIRFANDLSKAFEWGSVYDRVDLCQSTSAAEVVWPTNPPCGFRLPTESELKQAAPLLGAENTTEWIWDWYSVTEDQRDDKGPIRGDLKSRLSLARLGQGDALVPSDPRRQDKGTTFRLLTTCEPP